MTATLTAPLSSRSLSALDRCDRCGAQAYLAVAINTSELLFCAHHARAHGDKLREIGANITVDETHKLAPTNRQQGADHA